jgi:hypothetical protein
MKAAPGQLFLFLTTNYTINTNKLIGENSCNSWLCSNYQSSFTSATA